MMKKYLILVCLWLGISTAFAVQLPAEYSQYTLENGLTVYLWEDHDQPEVHGWTITRAGSIDEPADATGLAHYLEHMLFKGTETMSALNWEAERPYYEQIIALYDTLAMTDDKKAREAIQLRINEASLAAAKYAATDEFSNLVQGIGGEGLNAYTNYDQTCFMNSFPGYQLERWLTLYSDRLIHPVFRTFQAELENVFEEYNMYQDNNMTHVADFVNSHLYEGHAYARDIIGTPEDLKNPKLRKLIDFYNAWYVPGNMALVLVGDFSAEEAKPLIEKTFGRLEARPVPERQQYSPVPFNRAERYSAKLGYMPMVFIGYEGVPAGDEDELSLDFTLSLLSNSMGVGLFDRLAVDSKLMYASASSDSRRDLGRIELVAVPYMDPETQSYRSLEATEQLLLTAVDSLIAGRYSDDLLESVRESYFQRFDRAMEYPEMKVRLIEQSFIYRIPMSQMLAEKERVARVSRDDVSRMAVKYLTRPSRTFAIHEGTPHKDKLPKPNIKPLEMGHGKSAYAASFMDIPCGKLVPKFVDMSDVDQSLFYDNVSVFCTPNLRNNIFSLRLKYGVGTYEMPLLEYAVSMMNTAGIKGQPGRSANDVRAALARLGATCSYAVDENYLYVDVEGNENNLSEILSLVNLQMLLPDFSSEDDAMLNNMKGQEYSSRRVEQRNTDIVADAAYDYVVYGDNSSYLRRPSLREVMDLSASHLEGELHRAYDYALEIHYVGALTPDSVKACLYGHLPMSENARPGTSPVERPHVDRKDGFFFLEDKEMQQAKIYFYIDGEPYSSTQAVDYMAFDEYFGGGFSGLVMNEIREKRSMAYTAYGGFITPRVQGRKSYYIGYVGTQSDKVADAVTVYRSLLDSMPRNPENIESIRTLLRQSLFSNRPTFRRKSQRLTDWYRMGYKIDPAILRIRQVQKLQFEDIERFYETHVQGRPVTMLIMGDSHLIDMKALKARYGKPVKLNKAQLFSPSDL